MKRLILLLLIILGFASQTVALEESNRWQASFYHPEQHQIVVINQDGIAETLNLSDDVPNPIQPRGLGIQIIKRGRFLFYDHQREATIYFAPTEGFVAIPLPLSWETEPNILYATYIIGDVSPDRQQVVMGYIYRNNDELTTGGLFTFNLSDHQIQEHFPANIEDNWYPYHIEWRDDGIYLQVSETQQAPTRWEYMRWLPGRTYFEGTNEYGDSQQHYTQLGNEAVSADANFAYPHSGEQDDNGQFLPNVLHYRAHSTAPTEVIYWDFNGIRSVQWVANGIGVVIMGDSAQLLLRSGELITIDDMPAQVTPLPDGWLAFDGSTIYHYKYSPDQGVVREVFATIEGTLIPIEEPDLEPSVTGSFPAIEAYDWGQALCENNIPSTAQINSQAAQIREVDATIYSSTDETRIGIGAVPQGQIVSILDGPECIQGVPWWKVYYQESESRKFSGWMPEHTTAGNVWLEQRGYLSSESLEALQEYIELDTYFATVPDYSCQGFTAPIRLRTGMTAYVSAGPPNNVRSEPYMDAELIGQIPGGMAFEVVGGPACSDDVVWWEVIYQGTRGWTGEGIRNIYWTQLEPVGEETTPIVAPTQAPQCLGFLPSRLSIGQQASVTPGPANNVRVEASFSAEMVGQIPGGEQFTVLDGPVCAEEAAWWQVDYNGLVGWTAEGQGDTYWLEP